YNITLEKQAQQQGPAKRWWLDFPLADSSATLAELTETGLLFQGWVLLDNAAAVQIYVKQGQALSCFALDKPRPDVVQVILKQDAATHPQRNCGFRFNLAMSSADFELGILHNGVEHLL